MSTNRTFQDMLNQYLPNKLLKDEMIQRDYILTNCNKDDKWKGGKLIVPFKAAGASSVRMGALTASNDISEDEYVRGSIDDYKEAWGSMIFNHRDILDHSGRVVEDSFLKILPDTIDDFLDYMKMVVSIQLGTGPAFASATANGTVGGVLEVDRVERFVLNQKVTLKGDVQAAADYYVIAIDQNTDQVTFSATRGGAAADISAYTTADNAKCYTDDADVTSLQSIRDALLSAANGGSATLHGQSKIAYPFLQAINIDGSGITAANIIGEIFTAYVNVRRKAKGKAKKVLMSYKHMGSVLAALQSPQSGLQGNYQSAEGSRKVNQYGWESIMITSLGGGGSLEFVAIQEWDDDIIVFWDPESMTFRSNGFFRKRKSPEGLEYFEVRATTGYQYIVDLCLFGEFEITKPGNNGIIYNISY